MEYYRILRKGSENTSFRTDTIMINNIPVFTQAIDELSGILKKFEQKDPEFITASWTNDHANDHGREVIVEYITDTSVTTVMRVKVNAYFQDEIYKPLVYIPPFALRTQEPDEHKL